MFDWLIYVIGSNHQWARGGLLSEAWKAAGRPKHYVAYLCHPDTQVSDIDGGLLCPKGHKPIPIERKLPAKRGAYRR